MDLLNELPFNLRWYLLTTKDNKIIILYYKSPSDLFTEDDDTILETTYFQTVLSRYEFDDSQTIKKTRNENEMTINEFNNDIVEYCMKRNKVKEIRLINTQYTHKLIFEEKVYEALNHCGESLYFELGYSAIRIGSAQFKPLRKFEFVSGYIFPILNATITSDEFVFINVNINDYNGSPSDTNVINFAVKEVFRANSIQIYSTIQTGFVSSATDSESFDNSKISITYLKIYGQEILDDKVSERIRIFGPKTVNIGEIEVEDTVQYGNILKLNNITSFTLSKITRNVKKIEQGSFMVVGNVASVNVHDINYNLTPESYLQNDSSIIFFLNDEKKLTRKLNIYNTKIQNNSDVKINIVKLSNDEIEKICISTCDFGTNVNLMKIDESAKIKKLNITDSSFVSEEDIIFKRCNKISLTNCNFDTLKSINIKGSLVFLSNGIWNFEKLNIDSDDQGFIKLNTENVEFIGAEINLKGNSDIDAPYFDTESAFKVEHIKSNGFSFSSNKTKFHSQDITFNTSQSINLIQTFFFMNNEDIVFNSNGSICGNCVIGKSDKSNTFTLNIQDTEKKLNINSLDFIFDKNSPIVKCTTNVPVSFNMYQNDNEYSYISYTDNYDSKQHSKINFSDNIEKIIDHKLLTDSEKLCKIELDPEVTTSKQYLISKK